MISVAFLSPFPATGHGRCLPSQLTIPQLDAVSHMHCHFMLFHAARNLPQSPVNTHHYSSHCPSKQYSYQQLHSIAQYRCTFIQNAHFAALPQSAMTYKRNATITVIMFLVSVGTICQSVSQSVATRSFHSNITR